MKKLLFCTFICLTVACVDPVSETEDQTQDQVAQESPTELPSDGDIRIAFYNVENLFDTEDNPDKIDEDFLPEGKYAWTTDKYQVKFWCGFW